MKNTTDRRTFVKQSLALLGGACAIPAISSTAQTTSQPWFNISLAEWSYNRSIRNGTLDPLDFPVVARTEYDVDGVEYVNQLFMDKKGDQAFFNELKKRCDDNGVQSVLMMCDREGDLGDPNEARRKQCVENHYSWAESAKFLGCHSIRVNAASRGDYEEQIKLAADGLSRLSEFVHGLGMNVIVENHGGLSSNGEWLTKVIETVNMRNCGTLPDFGNFRIGGAQGEYDRYKGVKELMPFAKGVSAKTYDFDERGNETTIDYYRMMKIVKDAGYHGFVGIEYEGNNLSEPEGIRKTKELLIKARDVLS